MQRRALTPFACALLLFSVLPFHVSAQETQDEAAVPESLRPVRAALGEAYARLDGAAAAAHFADNAVVEFNGQVLSGKAAVTGWLTEALSGLTSLTAGTTVFVIGENEVTERAPYTIITRDGERQDGRSETVWKRQEDGTWKVARLIVL